MRYYNPRPNIRGNARFPIRRDFTPQTRRVLLPNPAMRLPGLFDPVLPLFQANNSGAPNYNFPPISSRPVFRPPPPPRVIPESHLRLPSAPVDAPLLRKPVPLSSSRKLTTAEKSTNTKTVPFGIPYDDPTDNEIADHVTVRTSIVPMGPLKEAASHLKVSLKSEGGKRAVAIDPDFHYSVSMLINNQICNLKKTITPTKFQNFLVRKIKYKTPPQPEILKDPEFRYCSPLHSQATFKQFKTLEAKLPVKKKMEKTVTFQKSSIEIIPNNPIATTLKSKRKILKKPTFKRLLLSSSKDEPDVPSTSRFVAATAPVPPIKDVYVNLGKFTVPPGLKLSEEARKFLKDSSPKSLDSKKCKLRVDQVYSDSDLELCTLSDIEDMMPP